MPKRNQLTFTIEELKKTACYKLNKDKLEQLTAVKQPKQQKRSNGSKTKAWIELQLTAWCEANGLTLIPEYRFSERRFRFDYAIFKDDKPVLAVEYEGGVFMEKSGHNTAKHYTKDTIKYNLAASLGWTIFRYTILNHTNLPQDLIKITL